MQCKPPADAPCPAGIALLQKTDVWSCGVLLFTLVTGTSPFQRVGDSQLAGEDKVKAVLQRIVRLDYSLPAWLSQECSHLITSLLEPGARAPLRGHLPRRSS